MKTQKYCKHCINPVGLHVINPLTGEELDFQETKDGFVCEICQDMISSGSLPTREQFNQEFDLFLQKSNRILFAHSGGLDSTVTLAKLAPECKKRGIELIIFTLKHGVKGVIAEKNIEDVLNFLGLKDDHFYLDISNKLQNDPKILAITGQPMKMLEVYKTCRERGILPCGKICNAMFDKSYETIMRLTGFNTLVTGGDTPKKNAKGVYSLFWKKPSGITIVRGAYAFGLSKAINLRFIQENRIPWVNPECGGYDTDCLIPGVFFGEGFDFNPDQKIEDVAKKYPIILDYLTERVRFGVIDYDEALKAITHVDIANIGSYMELMKIFQNTKNTKD